jgi:hypothetical protein
LKRPDLIRPARVGGFQQFSTKPLHCAEEIHRERMDKGTTVRSKRGMSHDCTKHVVLNKLIKFNVVFYYPVILFQ